MRVFERLEPKPMFFDEIDVRNAYRSGFTIGATTGATGMFVLCLLVGVFLVS